MSSRKRGCPQSFTSDMRGPKRIAPSAALDELPEADILARAQEITRQRRGREHGKSIDARDTGIPADRSRSFRQLPFNSSSTNPVLNSRQDYVGLESSRAHAQPSQDNTSSARTPAQIQESTIDDVLDRVNFLDGFPDSGYRSGSSTNLTKGIEIFDHPSNQHVNRTNTIFESSSFDDTVGFSDMLNDCHSYPTPAQAATPKIQHRSYSTWNESGAENGYYVEGLEDDHTNSQGETDIVFPSSGTPEQLPTPTSTINFQRLISRNESASSISEEGLSNDSSLSSSWEKVSPLSAPLQVSEELDEQCDSSKEPSKPKSICRRRRRPFQNTQMREGTSKTRKLKACLRCRMQRVRVREP